MKNRITTSYGISINLDKVTRYYEIINQSKDQVTCQVVIEQHETSTFFNFNTKQEKDIFLARLNNYFEEIR